MLNRSRMETLIVIGIAGFIGANVRYFVGSWSAVQFGTAFPWGTLIINLTGSTFLAMFFAWASSRTGLDPRIRLFTAVGFFGAYTTFSTYANDSAALITSGAWLVAAANILIENFLCVAGALIGYAIGSHL